MPHLHELEAQGVGITGTTRLLHLLHRAALLLPLTGPNMQSAQPSQFLDSASPANLARGIEQQIETIERLAARQYPESETQRREYECTLLKTRLREYASKVVPLQVREMGHDGPGGW